MSVKCLNLIKIEKVSKFERQDYVPRRCAVSHLAASSDVPHRYVGVQVALGRPHLRQT